MNQPTDVLITEELGAPAVSRLGQKHTILRDGQLWKNAGLLRERIATARAVMVRNQTPVTAELISAARHLVAIARVGVGLDNIDVEAASDAGIVVIAPLNANAVSVAELAMGFVLNLARKSSFADRSTRGGGWDRKGCTGMEVEGKTLLLCGMGRIGKLVARRALAFGMKVKVYDPFLNTDSPALEGLSVQLAPSLDQALTQADFVSVHSPLTPATKHLFNQGAFEKMKSGSFFINTSRGGIMDEAALIDALKSGHLAGAALDVREQEPPVPGSPLTSMDNVILSPHIGAFTHEAQTRTFEAVCDDLDRVLRGQPAVNFVNFPKPGKT